MAVIHYHLGGADPKLWSRNGLHPQGLAKCDEQRNLASHFATPNLLIGRSVPGESMEGGCACRDCEPLVVGDVITLIELPAGTLAQTIAYDVSNPDATFRFDLEVRNITDLTVAGTVVEAGLGGAKKDGAEAVNIYSSKYAEAGCKGRDCLGATTTYDGLDHQMLVMVVKALATPAAGCNPGCNPVGALKFDAWVNFQQFR